MEEEIYCGSLRRRCYINCDFNDGRAIFAKMDCPYLYKEGYCLKLRKGCEVITGFQDYVDELGVLLFENNIR